MTKYEHFTFLNEYIVTYNYFPSKTIYSLTRFSKGKPRLLDWGMSLGGWADIWHHQFQVGAVAWPCKGGF